MLRKRLLFLAQCLPYPANSGVRIRTFHNLRILSEHFEVRALCFFRRAGHRSSAAVQAAIRALAPLASVDAFPIPQEHSRSRLLADHIRSVATARTYTYWTHRDQRFIHSVKDALSNFKPDVVHLDSLDLSAVLDVLPSNVTISVCHHNVESSLLEKRAAAAGGASGEYLRIQSRLMRAEEARCTPRVSVNFVVSEPDAAALRQIAPTARFVVAPNGVDTTAQRPLESRADGLVFVGGANWLPNLDALEHFSKNILPLLRVRLPNMPITWVGQCSNEQREQYRSQYGIELTGFVDSIVPYLEKSSIFIVPMRIGGGTRLKILDAWSYALPVVSTGQGAEGLRVRSGENILLANEPADFVEAVVQLHQSSELRKSIGAQGRMTAETYYDWAKIGKVMLDELENIPAATNVHRARIAV